MSDIKPALTPEQWTAISRGDHTYDPHIDIAGIFYSADQCFAAMASLNESIPDDDPRKITREEVATVRHEAQRIASEWEPDEPAYRDAVILFALAAKLAALLPPE